MQRIIVDITPGFRMPTIYFSQGDVGTQFEIDLRSRFGNTLPASPTVTIQATKPSGFGFSVAATSVTNGVAVFTTTAEMTDEAGRFPAELKVVKDSVSLFSANFYMSGEATTHPEGTIDGQQETVIPELSQLVDRVEEAASSVLDRQTVTNTLSAGSQATYSFDEDTNTQTFGIPQGEAGAGAAGVTASAYSSSSTYAVGDYVIHNSNLYRCTTAITTAESFTAAHWTQVVLGDEVSDLKSDLTYYYDINKFEFESGGIYNGVETEDTTRIRSKKKIRVYAGMHIKFNGIYNGLWVGSYNLDGTWRANGSWTKDFTVAQDGYVRIVLCKRYNATIAVEDYPTLISATSVLYDFVYVYNKLLEDIAVDDSNISALQSGLIDVDAKAELPLLAKYTQQTETGYAIKNNVSIGSTVNMTPQAIEGYASIVIKHIPKGMKFRVFGTSSYYYLCYSWLDKDAKMLEKPEAWTPSHESGIVVTAPADDCMLVCSSNASYTYGFYVESLCSVVNLYNSLANSDALVEQKKNVKNNLLGSATADFVFFSDIHDGSTNFNKIIDYAEDNSVDAILNGGDTILKYLNDAEHPMTWYTDGITASSVDILSAVGNHDVWDGAYWTKADAVDVYNAFIAPIVAKYSDIVQPTGASTNGLCYYYKDYSSVRVIVLNAMAGDSSVNFWDTTQANWLTSVLSDAKTNSKHVLIVNHAPFQKTIAVRDERLHWNSYIDYTTLSTYDGLRTTPDAVQIVKNFIDSGGMFVGWLTGHLHFDNVITATGFDKQIMFNIATANNAIHNDGVSYTDVTSQYYDCFNHIAVDTAKGLVKMIRVGWNTDYSIKTREELCYDYINGKLLTDN